MKGYCLIPFSSFGYSDYHLETSRGDSNYYYYVDDKGQATFILEQKLLNPLLDMEDRQYLR